jgi:hypothetical protein
MPSSPKIISVAHGFSDPLLFTIYDEAGNPATGYTGVNALGCKIWQGQDQASLLNLTPTWATPPNLVALTITDANSAALPVGRYSMQVWVVADSGDRNLFYDGALDITETAGSAVAITADISYYDLTLYVPQIRILADSLVDLTGFLTERHGAQQWFASSVLDRYRPQVGRSRRYLNAAGTATGPILKYSPDPMGSSNAPTLDDLKDYFAAGGLCLDKHIMECQAHYAASVIYLGQPGRDNVYQQAGMSHRAQAMALFDQCVVELDTTDPPTDPPTPVIRVDRDVTYLT